MGVGTDHGIRPGINVGVGSVDLGILEFCAVFHTPVGEGNDEVGICGRSAYGFQEAGIVIAPEDPGLRIGRLRRIDRVLRARRSDIGDFESPGLQVNGRFCLLYCPAGTDIGDPRILQCGQGIQERLLSEIEGMVIGQSDNIHSQILQIRHVGGISAEGPGLPGQRRPAEAVDKFIIDPHQVHALHDLDIAGIDPVRDIL